MYAMTREWMYIRPEPQIMPNLAGARVTQVPIPVQFRAVQPVWKFSESCELRTEPAEPFTPLARTRTELSHL